MRTSLSMLMLAAALAGCARTQTQTGGTDRPLWDDSVRDQTTQFKSAKERERYRSIWHEQLEWEPPNYHPIKEQWRESGDAWRNVGENR